MWQTMGLVATKWDSIWAVIWSQKYENAMPETPENAVLHLIIYLYLANYFIYKLIHIDLKPRILIDSFLLAPLLND